MSANPYRQVLWATDLLEHSKPVGLRAQEIAQRYGARLSVLHVIALAPSFEFGGELALPPYREIEEQIVKQAEVRLQLCANNLGLDNKLCHVVIGSASYEIIRFSRENNVDLIVVGRHARHGLGVLLGSTASGVLHGAGCDVMAITI